MLFWLIFLIEVKPILDSWLHMYTQYPSRYFLIWVSISIGNRPINLFRSWHTFIKNKLMCISLFFTIVCQLRNKFMLMWNKNIFIPNVWICQTTWQQQKFPKQGKKDSTALFEIHTYLIYLSFWNSSAIFL